MALAQTQTMDFRGLALDASELQIDGVVINPDTAAASTFVADALVNYTDDGGATDLDTDARRVAAMNATNGKINSILDILIAHGLMAAS
jgi:cytoskeletal protein RodZ